MDPSSSSYLTSEYWKTCTVICLQERQLYLHAIVQFETAVCTASHHHIDVGSVGFLWNRMHGEMWPHSHAYQVAVTVMNSPLLVLFADAVQHQFSPLNGLTHRCRHTTATCQRLTEVSYNRMFCNSPSMTEPFMHSTAHAHHQAVI